MTESKKVLPGIIEQIESIQNSYGTIPFSLFHSAENVNIDESEFDSIEDVLEDVIQLIKVIDEVGLEKVELLQIKAEMEVYKLLDGLGSNVNIMRDMGVCNVDVLFYKLQKAFFELLLAGREIDDIQPDIVSYLPKINFLKSEFSYDSEELGDYYTNILDELLEELLI